MKDPASIRRVFILCKSGKVHESSFSSADGSADNYRHANGKDKHNCMYAWASKTNIE